MATFHEMTAHDGAPDPALLRQGRARRPHRPSDRRIRNPDGTLLPITDDNRHLALEANDRIANAGERVMVVAQRDLDPGTALDRTAT